MIKAQYPANEIRRLAALESYKVLDTHAEAAFDALTRAAASICDVPIALISLVDRDRQWFKSAVGLGIAETPRDVSFCGHAIHSNKLLEVPDTLADERFSDNPLVTADPNIRFYAGAPLATREKLAIGALCVIDRKPRRLTKRQRAVLAQLSDVVMHLLEGRKAGFEAAERLNKANRLLEMGEKVGHFGHFQVDAATGELRWSEETFRIHGLPKGARQPSFEEAVQFFHPDDQTVIRSRAQTVIAAGAPYSSEYRIVRPDGATRAVYAWVEPQRSSDGAITGTFGVVQDITERKRAEIEAQRNRDRFNAIFDTVVDGILIADPATGRFIEANDAATRMFGHARSDLIGCDIGKISSGVHPYTLEAAIERHRTEIPGQSQVFEWHCKAANGALFWAEISTRYARFGDAPALVAMLHDITERKDAERELIRLKENAEQASRAKSDFLAAMSHEVRTPMNGVLGMNALMLETSLTPHQRKLAETIRFSADALLNVVDDILDVAKLEAGRVTLEESDFDLPALVEKAVELLDARARQKGIALSAEFAAGGRGVFHGEPTRLRQILLNLVSNAIKFTERGGVTIVVAGAEDEDQDGYARIRVEVRDTGMGVSAEAKQRLFTAFEQADPSIARRFGGTGLGLNICRKLVELMDGEIGIADRPGGGSVFWFEVSLPRVASDAAGPAELENPGQTRATAPASGHILLAEDNRVNIEVAKMILEGSGYTVDVAVDGTEAVAAARRRDYDLILMDMQMPRMDGLTATREIRASEGSRRRAPIIAMTANAMAGDRRLCVEAGMDDYVSKPFAPEKLRETIAQWIEASAAQNSADSAARESLSVIEPEAIDALRSCMSAAKFASLMGVYLAQADADARRFPFWQSTLSTAEIGDEAHKIISSAGAFGARRLQDLAGRLQSVCRSGNRAATPGLIQELARAAEAASSELRRMLAA